MPWGLGIGAGIGLLKNELIDKPEAARQRKMQAEIARYSPWTHMDAHPVANPNALNSALQFGSTGAAMGYGINKEGLNNAAAKSLDKPPYDPSSDPYNSLPDAAATPDTTGVANKRESGLMTMDPSTKSDDGNYHGVKPETTDVNPFDGSRMASSKLKIPMINSKLDPLYSSMNQQSPSPWDLPSLPGWNQGG